MKCKPSTLNSTMHYNPIMISQLCLRGTVFTGWPLTWITGKSQGKYIWRKSQGNSWKSVKVMEKWTCFSKWLRKCWRHAFCVNMLSKDECYGLVYCWQIGVRGKQFKSGKSQGKWKLKIMTTLLQFCHMIGKTIVVQNLKVINYWVSEILTIGDIQSGSVELA